MIEKSVIISYLDREECVIIFVIEKSVLSYLVVLSFVIEKSVLSYLVGFVIEKSVYLYLVRRVCYHI